MEMDKIEIPVKFHIDITTSVNGGKIKHVVTTSSGGYADVVKHLLDTTEEETKKALVALGWTPPEDKEE